MEYSGTRFDNLYLDTNLTHKITKANIYVFKEDGTLIDQDKYTISAANIFNMTTDGKTKYRVIVIWYINENQSEDNLSLIPNMEDVRKYVIYPDTDQDKSPISLQYLKTEFDFGHVHQKPSMIILILLWDISLDIIRTNTMKSMNTLDQSIWKSIRKKL